MRNDAYLLELMSIYRTLPDEKKSDFMTRFNAQARNPVVIFGFSVFLGYFGIDRFLLGQVLLGILKLITFGGFGLWVLIDLFLVAGTAREKNLDVARSIAENIGHQQLSAKSY
jgi:TM2 domain-containing membrane protein YozV